MPLLIGHLERRLREEIDVGPGKVFVRLSYISGYVSFMRRIVSSSSFVCRIGNAILGVRWKTVR
jgi:hypothetical protein